MPAIMKGFFDRIFLPGFFFNKIPNSKKWEKLLKNKSGRIIYTLDTPRLLWWMVGKPSYRALKYVTLGYCGVKPIKGTPIGIIRLSTEDQRNKWLEKIERLGSKHI
jgi:putative NADPH-quinone reductase